MEKSNAGYFLIGNSTKSRDNIHVGTKMEEKHYTEEYLSDVYGLSKIGLVGFFITVDGNIKKLTSRSPMSDLLLVTDIIRRRVEGVQVGTVRELHPLPEEQEGPNRLLRRILYGSESESESPDTNEAYNNPEDLMDAIDHQSEFSIEDRNNEELQGGNEINEEMEQHFFVEETATEKTSEARRILLEKRRKRRKIMGNLNRKNIKQIKIHYQ